MYQYRILFLQMKNNILLYGHTTLYSSIYQLREGDFRPLPGRDCGKGDPLAPMLGPPQRASDYILAVEENVIHAVYSWLL